LSRARTTKLSNCGTSAAASNYQFPDYVGLDWGCVGMRNQATFTNQAVAILRLD